KGARDRLDQWWGELQQEQQQHARQRESEHAHGILPMGWLSRNPGQILPLVPALLDVVRDALRDLRFLFRAEVMRRRLRFPDLSDEGRGTEGLGIDAGN